MTLLGYRFNRFLFSILTAFVFLCDSVNALDCPPAPLTPTAEQIKQLSATARDRGFLWKISKDGHSSWLYGTLHVGRLEWAMPGPRVIEALQSSAVIALELDLTNPATLEKLTLLSHQGAGAIPEALMPRVKKQLDTVCLPATTISEMNPLLLLSTVELLAARRQGLDAAYGVEFVLTGYAHAGKKPIVELETAESQMLTLLGPGGEVSADDIDAALQQLERGDSDTILKRLVQVWALGDVDDLTSYASWCHCMDSEKQREDMQKLLDDRNGPLANAIDALHAQGKPIFAAVGALHMIGNMGLPALLKRQGYTVSPIPFNH